MVTFTPIASPKDKRTERSLSKKCKSCRETLAHSQFQFSYGSEKGSSGIYRGDSCKGCDGKTPFPKVSVHALQEKVLSLQDEIEEMKKDIALLFSYCEES